MYPMVHIYGHSFYTYDLINALLAVPAIAVYFYFSLRSIGIKNSQILIFFFLGYIVEYFGGWLIPLFNRMVILHQTQWFYTWDKPPGRYFHSVLVVYLLYTLVVCKIWRWPVWKILDRWIIGVLMASAIARFGCLIQGCCEGKLCDLPWAIRFPAQPDIARYPTQVFMIVLESALTFFLWRLGKKIKYDGQVFWVGILAYSIYRYLIEYLRTNPVIFLGLTHAQLFSLVCAELALGVLIYNRRKRA